MSKMIGLVIYWLACLYIVVDLVLLSDWSIFTDILSWIVVIVPTLAVLLVVPGDSMKKKLCISLKVCWLSGGMMFVYGLVLIFSSVDDMMSIFPSLAVALLPIIYCFVISLLYAPIVFDVIDSSGKDS